MLIAADRRYLFFLRLSRAALIWCVCINTHHGGTMKYHLKSWLFLLTLIFVWLSVLASSTYQGSAILLLLNALAALSAVGWLIALLRNKLFPQEEEGGYLSESEIADIKRAPTQNTSRSTLSNRPAKSEGVADVVALSAMAVAVSSSNESSHTGQGSEALCDDNDTDYDYDSDADCD